MRSVRVNSGRATLGLAILIEGTYSVQRSPDDDSGCAKGSAVSTAPPPPVHKVLWISAYWRPRL